MRTLRQQWWPRFIVGAGLLIVVGIELLSGAVQAAAIVLGVLVCLFALARGLNTDDSYQREPPMPPASGPPT